MKLISSKKTKRQIALLFVFAFMLSNLLSLFGPSANAAVTITAPSAGTCFQHTGTTASGALVTVYNIGTVQVSLTASEVTPGDDAAATDGITAGVARATLAGSISAASDVIGNVFSIVPPTGTNFVIVPGFADTAATNHLAAANASISNTSSSDTSASVDSTLGVSVGVVTTGTSGIGRAIVAIARDAGDEVYPKSGTSTNTVTVSFNGLGIAIPPSGDGSLSGTLQATFDSTPPSGIGVSGGASAAAVASGIPGLSGTLNLCTVTTTANQLEAVSDADDDTTDLYDKTASSSNLIALSQIGSFTSLTAQDLATNTATPRVDLEPILIRGTTGTGTATRDQVFATGELLSDIDTNAESPSTSALDLATAFGNNVITPITIAFSDDNATATTTLNAVDIIIENSTAPTTAAGFSATQSSRFGFLGALRAAQIAGGNTASVTAFVAGSHWGITSNRGDTAVVQEANRANANNTVLNGSFGGLNANNTEPFNDTFVDLRINCDGSAPVAGWFAIGNGSNAGAQAAFGTTANTNQLLARSQAGSKLLVSSLSNFYTQNLTNIAGTTPGTTVAGDFNPTPFLGGANAIVVDSTLRNNALLYASCANNTLTLFPIQDAFDATRDILAITPKLTVSNISNTLSSDTNIVAQISGNNLSGTTTLNLTKLLGAIGTSGGQTSTLAAATGVGLSEAAQLAINCSSGSSSTVTLSSVTATSLDATVAAACTSGSIATPPALFKGGAPNTVSGTTVIDGSPVVQSEGRGVLLKELSATGFSELVNKVGGGSTGTVIEVQLPSGCDVIDDRDDNNTAAASGGGGNDVTMFTLTSTAGVSVAATGIGTTPADLTVVNAVIPSTGADPALLHFGFTSASGVGTDATTTDAVLLRLDAQDIFCPSTVADGALTGLVRAQNKTVSPTITENLGSVSFGTATSAATFSIADDVVTSTKGETSTNTMIGTTPRLSGGSVTTANPFKIVENNARSFPIGGRVSARNLDPENTVLSAVITKGQLWVVPAASTAFSTAPAAADVSFSDNSIVIDGNPYIVTSATVDPNPPLGTLVIPIKKGSGDPTVNTTTVTVRNLKLGAATSSTTDLVASVQFFLQDAGVVVNTPGIASGNSATTPTLFTPYVRGGTKAGTQLNTAGVQLGTGSLANSLLTSRLTTEGAPQLSPFATVVSSAKNADASKITVSATAVAGSSGSTSTDNTVTVTGAAGSVDGGAQVVVTTGSGTTTYDSVTVVSSTDGSFTAKLRGDCASPATSVSVTVAESVSGTATTSVSKTALCNGSTGDTADSVFTEIAGADGTATITEVLNYITSKGGLSAVISAGGATLDGVIKAVKSVLGLS